MKPRLYLLAGNGGAADWWDEVLSLFEHYDPRPIELPGFGDNPQPPLSDLGQYAEALLAQTEAGSAIYAVGVNALIVLHALQRRPGHFSRTVLQAPVGAFLWQRRLPALMSPRPVRWLVHQLLSYRPAWFANKFSRQRWSAARYARMGHGYRRCRAFRSYWDMVRADNALPMLEWITDPVELIWGEDDAVLGREQAAAWSAVLARADLRVSIRPGWGHYPWIDTPADFVSWLESGEAGFVAHGKGGRLQLAALAGLPVPPAMSFETGNCQHLPEFLQSQASALWAVRSSRATEDQADHANAGLSTTYLRVTAPEVAAHVAELHQGGVETVVVQRFVEPVISGIAFVRHLSAEVEWVEGHLEQLADGHLTPHRAILSRLGGEWAEGEFPKTHELSSKLLWDFLQRVLRCFHYVHGDIEWAWDGQQLWLLQYRPISDYGWRRHLTAANIAEILPPQPSRLVEYAQQRAAGSIPAIMARWDARVLEDNEAFTARFGGASYINNDLYLARLADWGLPSRSVSAEVGGSVPHLPWRPLRLLRSLPLLWRMQQQSRQALHELEENLHRYNTELENLHRRKADGQTLADWFARFYVTVVQGNLCIATALAGSGGSLLGQPPTAYQEIGNSPHRLPWETDPATSRENVALADLQPFPTWSVWMKSAHRCGLPGMRGYYLQVREWYRDNLMRIFFSLHHAMPEADRAHWFAPHPHPRNRYDSFWQDGRSGEQMADSFVIYPGAATGVIGQDILLVDTLDPGRYAEYREAKAVIARMGGRLSHGATLLRELRKPSAVIPSLLITPGQRVRYEHGSLKFLD